MKRDFLKNNILFEQGQLLNKSKKCQKKGAL